MPKLTYLILPLLIFTACQTHEVIMAGQFSDTPWQHMIAPPDTHPNAYYFDTEDKDQFVIYTATEISCQKKFKIFGAYIDIEGTSKRPGSKEKVTERQIKVDEIECL